MAEQTLICVIGELVICAHEIKEPKPENVHRVKCPGCLKKETFLPIADVVQQGFFENDCRTVFECQNCTYQVYVRYQVPVYQVVDESEVANADS